MARIVTLFSRFWSYSRACDDQPGAILLYKPTLCESCCRHIIATAMARLVLVTHFHGFEATAVHVMTRIDQSSAILLDKPTRCGPCCRHINATEIARIVTLFHGFGATTVHVMTNRVPFYSTNQLSASHAVATSLRRK